MSLYSKRLYQFFYKLWAYVRARACALWFLSFYCYLVCIQESSDSETRLPKFESCFQPRLGVRASYFTSLCLCFLNGKMSC